MLQPSELVKKPKQPEKHNRFADMLIEGATITGAGAVIALVTAIGIHLDDSPERVLGNGIIHCAENFTEYDELTQGQAFVGLPPECNDKFNLAAYLINQQVEAAAETTLPPLTNPTTPSTQLVGDINNPSVVEVTTTSTSLGPVVAGAEVLEKCVFNPPSPDDHDYRTGSHDCYIRLDVPTAFDLEQTGDRLIQIDNNRIQSDRLNYPLVGAAIGAVVSVGYIAITRSAGDDDRPPKLASAVRKTYKRIRR